MKYFLVFLADVTMLILGIISLMMVVSVVIDGRHNLITMMLGQG